MKKLARSMAISASLALWRPEGENDYGQLPVQRISLVEPERISDLYSILKTNNPPDDILEIKEDLNNLTNFIREEEILDYQFSKDRRSLDYIGYEFEKGKRKQEFHEIGDIIKSGWSGSQYVGNVTNTYSSSAGSSVEIEEPVEERPAYELETYSHAQAHRIWAHASAIEAGTQLNGYEPPTSIFGHQTFTFDEVMEIGKEATIGESYLRTGAMDVFNNPVQEQEPPSKLSTVGRAVVKPFHAVGDFIINTTIRGLDHLINK